MSKLLSKLTGKNKACEEKQLYTYKVKVVLDKSCYNKEMNKYIFVNPIDSQILIVNSQEVEFETIPNLYRIADNMYNGPFKEATIKRIVNE